MMQDPVLVTVVLVMLGLYILVALADLVWDFCYWWRSNRRHERLMQDRAAEKQQTGFTAEEAAKAYDELAKAAMASRGEILNFQGKPMVYDRLTGKPVPPPTRFIHARKKPRS